MNDPINPQHYKHLPAEAIDIIMAAIARAPSNESAYLQGQVLKYLLRCWSKKGIEDLRKAKWYLDRMVDQFDDLLAEASGANDPTKPSKTQPPIGYYCDIESTWMDEPSPFEGRIEPKPKKSWAPKIGEKVIYVPEGSVWTVRGEEKKTPCDGVRYILRHGRFKLRACLGELVPLKAQCPVGYYCDVESSGAPSDEPSELSSKQPPSGCRLLGDAKDEPRCVGDIHWCAVANGWCSVTEELAPFANRDNWTACRKIIAPVDEPIEPPRRYREPTRADLRDGPMKCEYRDDDDEQWRSGFLVYILNGSMPFLCTDKEEQLSGQWEQCQIEVTE